MKRSIIILFFILSSIANAQDVVGFWYGNANVENGSSANNYLVELILKQNKTNVEGIINYYFKNTFRSFKLNGHFNSSNRVLNIYSVPVTYFASSNTMEVDCVMDFTAILRVAKTGSTLNGKFAGKPQYRNTCPEIIFNLQLNKEAKNQDSILTALSQYKETYQVWRPSAVDTLVSATIINRPVINYVVAKQYKERENVVTEEIIVDGDSLQIDFYDNGEVDGDSISIFYNKNLVAFNRVLSAKAIHFEIALDSSKTVNEISMFADNLGAIPPNTALMLIYDGKKRHEIRMTSSLQKNASVLIRRKKQ